MTNSQKFYYKIPNLSEILDILKSLNFLDWLVFISCLRCFVGYFVPLNILYNAPHDDFLFYRLANSITDFNWLGDYDQLVLLKGAGFPIFLSLSKFFYVPLRILEAAFLSFAAAYLVTSPIFKNFTDVSKFIIFVIIIFIPFQYTALDYRLLRDMIYPWLLLIAMGSMARLILSNQSKKFMVFHGLILGTALGFFDITREEGIWVVPSFCFMCVLLFFTTKKFEFKRLLIPTCAVFVSFATILSLISVANFIKYDSSIRTEFRNGGFASGYGKLYRFRSKTDVRRASLSSEDWTRLFDVIPAAAPLKNYVTGPAYQGWVGTSCSAIRSQHPWENNPDCDDVMLNGYLMMALKDGIYAAGFRSPQSQSDLMTNIGIEIDRYCAENNNKCFPAAISMMPPETFSLSAIKATLNNLPRSFGVMVDSNNANVRGWKGSGSFFQQLEVAKYFSSYILYDPVPKKGVVANFTQKAIFNTKGISSAGVIESVTTYEGALNIYGWVRPKFNNPDVLINANGLMCATKPTIMRPDVGIADYPLGFFCSIPLSKNLENGVGLIAKVSYENEVYFVDQTEDVTNFVATIRSSFDEDCYLSENPDVAAAVKAGNFQSGFEHYSKHGHLENRNCGGISDGFDTLSKKFPQWIQKLENSLSLQLIKQIVVFYQFFCDVGVFFVFAGLFVCFLEKRYFIGGFISICICLVATRLTLISLLDFNGLAPITGLYLYSATLIWTCVSAISSVLVLEAIVRAYRKRY